MTEKKKSLLVSVIFFVFGIFLYVQSLGIKHMMKNDVGSAFFPKVIAITIMVVAVIRLVLTLRSKESTQVKKSNSDMVGGWLTILLIGLYVLTFNAAGFLISTAVYLFLQILVLIPADKRRIPVITTISVVAPLLIYALFVYAINIPLPKGIFYF